MENVKFGKHYGVISDKPNGWSLQVNAVSWFGKHEKLDIRPWDENLTNCGKGLSLDHAEAKALYEILRGIFGGGKE